MPSTTARMAAIVGGMDTSIRPVAGDRVNEERWKHPRLGAQDIGGDDIWLAVPFVVIVTFLVIWALVT